MATLNVEDVDLAEQLESLRARLGDEVEGALLGRTRMRDVVRDRLGCSELEAERVVDTMVGRGFIHLVRDPLGLSSWKLGGH